MRAALGLGSNLGDREAHLRAATAALATLGPLRASAVHETEPLGPPQPRYLNAAVVVDCALDPFALLAFARALEERAGRVRGERWGPRTLDVDLLLCDGLVVDDARLRVPHPGLHRRAFVLAPLAEIAPDWVVPGLGRTVAQLHADLLQPR